MVRIWAWLVTNLFKYKRCTIYLSSGFKIKFVRPEEYSPAMYHKTWTEWLASGQGPLVIEEGKRRVMVWRGEVRGVDIR